MSFQDQMFEQLPQWDQARVRQAKILVVGAGALGNEVLKNLALLNVQQIAIMDFDQVEASNLSRSILFRPEDAVKSRYKAEVAAERLLEINPDLKILTLLGDVVTDLSLGFLRSLDLVIGCVDNRLARLYLNRLCWRAGIPWVDGGILNLSGQVAAYVPQHSCYECGLGPAAWQDIRQRMGCSDMARRYAINGQAVTTPIAASIIGAMQVQEGLKLVLGLAAQSLAGKMFSFEGAHLQMGVYESKPIRAICDSHFEPNMPLQAQLSSGSTLAEVFVYLRRELDMQSPAILLDHSVALSVADLHTGAQANCILPIHHFSDRLAREFAGDTGGQWGIPKGAMIERISDGQLEADLPLWRFGIPEGHVLRIADGSTRKSIQLANDNPKFKFDQGIRALQNRWWLPNMEMLTRY